MGTKSTKDTLALLDEIIDEKLTFGNMLANIRECEEMSQSDFAKILGVSRHYLCDIEHDRKNVSATTAYAYAKKLGYSPKQFVRLALQGQIDRAGIHLTIVVSSTNKHHAMANNAQL